MRNRRLPLLGGLIAFLLLGFGAAVNAFGELKVEWGRPLDLGRGLYARIHHVYGNRLMAAYSMDDGIAVRFASPDTMASWTEPRIVARHLSVEKDGQRFQIWLANAEFAQLDTGRIILACNLRPQDRRHDIHPYSIAISTSDDAGETWSPLRIVYKAEISSPPDENEHGCYEPFVLPLKDGNAQIYFADETPYDRDGYQNISVVETHDGGESWSAVRIAAYKPGGRDGMPSALDLGAWRFLAIETSGPGMHLHPEIVRTRKTSNWCETVGDPSPDRFGPLAEPPDWKAIYGGAPYLVATKNCILLSWQQCKGGLSLNDGLRAHVAVMPKTYAMDGRLTAMRMVSSPPVAENSPSMLWNSLCHVAGDMFLLVTESGGRIIVYPGRITW